MNYEDKQHIRWIDAAKGVAIIAVIIDHSYGVLYTNRILSLLSYFSVSVFVFLGGITSYISCEKHANKKVGEIMIKRGKSIIVPYIGATCVYQLVITGMLEMPSLLQHLFRFDITGPFYFVLFYVQLLLVSPILYRLINCWNRNNEKIIHIILVFTSVFVAIFCVRRTFIVDVWGGGKYLLGGSYFTIFLLGQVWAHYGCVFLTVKQNLGCHAVALFCVECGLPKMNLNWTIG